MANGNRYAAAMDPPAGAAPTGPPMPPPGGPPPQGPPPGAPDGQAPAPAAAPNPALAEALQILQGHEGKVADLLKDPASLQHVRVVFEHIKQDPQAQQMLAQQGIGPDKLQQFEAMLVQAEQGGKTQAAPHWLAR